MRKIVKQSCGCEVIHETYREVWGNLCPTHNAEQTALHEAAQRAHTEEARMRALAEELT
jgi:hypothetical protein